MHYIERQKVTFEQKIKTMEFLYSKYEYIR